MIFSSYAIILFILCCNLADVSELISYTLQLSPRALLQQRFTAAFVIYFLKDTYIKAGTFSLRQGVLEYQEGFCGS